MLLLLKQCFKCKRNLSFSEFYKYKLTKDGLRYNCKDCQKEYYIKNRDRILIQRKGYRKKNKDKIKKQARLYRKENPNYNKEWHEKNFNYSKEYHKEYRQTNKEKRREYRRKNRLKIINHYTNASMSCINCGYSDVRALSIDHINNDGAEQRKIHGTGGKFYYWLIKNDYPEGFQILCRNCNYIKNLEYRGNL